MIFTPAQMLPHAHEMLLLDTIEDHGDGWVRVALGIREHSLFCQPGRGVPGWVGIEYMAQAIGVFSGIELARAGQQPKIGLLIGTRRYTVAVPYFKVGSHLQVEARLRMRDEENLVVFACEINRDGETLAQAEIKGYRPDNIHSYLDQLT